MTDCPIDLTLPLTDDTARAYQEWLTAAKQAHLDQLALASAQHHADQIAWFMGHPERQRRQRRRNLAPLRRAAHHHVP